MHLLLQKQHCILWVLYDHAEHPKAQWLPQDGRHYDQTLEIDSILWLSPNVNPTRCWKEIWLTRPCSFFPVLRAHGLLLTPGCAPFCSGLGCRWFPNGSTAINSVFVDKHTAHQINILKQIPFPRLVLHDYSCNISTLHCNLLRWWYFSYSFSKGPANSRGLKWRAWKDCWSF